MIRKLTSCFDKIRTSFSQALIEKSELKITILSCIVAFLATINYNIFKVIKDTLVLSIESYNGIILLTSLKIWAITPFSMLSVYLINRMNHKMSLQSIFYVISAFYVALLFLLYKYYSIFPSLYFNLSINSQHSILNTLFTPFLYILNFWPLSLVYIISEIWQTTIFLFVFWSFLNYMFTQKMTKKIYPIINMVGSSSGLFIEPLFRALKTVSGDSSWDAFIAIIALFSIATIFMLDIFFKLLCNNMYKNKIINNKLAKEKINKEKVSRVSIVHGIKKMIKSPYISSLIFTIISYNVVLNLTEIMWKDMISQTYGSDKVQIAQKLSLLITGISVCSILFGVLLPFMMTSLGVKWSFTSYPLTALIFIGFFLSKHIYSTANFSSSACLDSYIWAGYIGLVVLRAGKYVVYDSIKDMLLSILPYRTMVETKGLVDTIFSRIGKSVASSHYNLTSSYISSSFAMSSSKIIVLITGLAWTTVSFTLGQSYEDKSVNKE